MGRAVNINTKSTACRLTVGRAAIPGIPICRKSSLVLWQLILYTGLGHNASHFPHVAHVSLSVFCLCVHLCYYIYNFKLGYGRETVHSSLQLSVSGPILSHTSPFAGWIRVRGRFILSKSTMRGTIPLTYGNHVHIASCYLNSSPCNAGRGLVHELGSRLTSSSCGLIPAPCSFYGSPEFLRQCGMGCPQSVLTCSMDRSLLPLIFGCLISPLMPFRSIAAPLVS